jgi:hypothetical protein
MNPCRSIQRRLLALSAPDDPPAAVREHLEGCADCREWQRRVVQVERGVGLLPVAPSQAGVAFLREFRAADTPWQRLRARVRLAPRWQVAWVSAAAGVLLVLGGLSILPGAIPGGRQPIDPVAPDPLVAKLYQRNLDLAKPSTPQKQIETLVYLAEDLRGESQSLAATLDGRQLLNDVLAKSYSRVVDAVVDQSRIQAKVLNEKQRQELLVPVERLLARASDDAEQTVRETGIDSANHPLLSIANSARKARDGVKEILGPNKASALPRPPSGHARRSPPSDFPSANALLVRGNPLALLAVVGEEVQAIGQAAEQAQRFGRNRVVIQALVDNSLDLAFQPDPANRAACCAALAGKLAREIEAAVPANPGRALELGPYVGDLLKRGVAENVNAVPRGDPRDAKLLQIGADVRRLTRQLDQEMSRLKDPDVRDAFERVLRTVAFGRDEVEKALQGRGTL